MEKRKKTSNILRNYLQKIKNKYYGNMIIILYKKGEDN